MNNTLCLTLKKSPNLRSSETLYRISSTIVLSIRQFLHQLRDTPSTDGIHFESIHRIRCTSKKSTSSNWRIHILCDTASPTVVHVLQLHELLQVCWIVWMFRLEVSFTQGEVDNQRTDAFYVPILPTVFTLSVI
ncbi:hypothetical protein FGIG_02342 [Fasciola gigantica]|uniref:Uncharacterized protein n=1 Tax=Fasciola gigantica TaxID=46835 RepID=A0A504Z0J4_FASGI|nr:hypothetical protein FGIG_02342 [Fasciola gigantica]